jgi:predicted metal-dependent enzyme (double-stranded beta helix superfamily)
MDDLSSIAAKRKEACTILLRRVREIHSGEGVSAASLSRIKGLLIDLAAQGTALFPDEDFAMPDAHGRAHMLDAAADDGFGLYLTVNLPGKESAPHDHGIWCVNAALSGAEIQRFYRRTDDGRKPGFATIEQIAEETMGAGTGIAMLDHDIHGTLAIGDKPARALALYGYALNRFPAVVFFHPQFSSCRTVPSKRAAARA